jgi:hypothetical protein
MHLTPSPVRQAPVDGGVISKYKASQFRQELVTGKTRYGGAISAARLESNRRQLATFDASGKRQRVAKWGRKLDEVSKGVQDGVEKTVTAIKDSEEVIIKRLTAVVRGDPEVGDTKENLQLQLADVTKRLKQKKLEEKAKIKTDRDERAKIKTDKEEKAKIDREEKAKRPRAPRAPAAKAVSQSVLGPAALEVLGNEHTEAENDKATIKADRAKRPRAPRAPAAKAVSQSVLGPLPRLRRTRPCRAATEAEKDKANAAAVAEEMLR